MSDGCIEVPFKPEYADYFDLTEDEVELVALVERRFSRAAIAAYWHGFPTNAEQFNDIRDQVGGLCDFYRCPTSELPSRVREVAKQRFEGTE